MITKEKYTILDKPEPISEINTKLCIFNFDILEHTKYVKNLVEKNKNTTFWVTSNTYSKEYIKNVSKLGIQNVVQFPLDRSVFENFFKNDKGDNPSICYPPLKSAKILIVDDNELNIELLQETLKDLGTEIKTCTDSLTASDLIQTEKFDLLLLDILMPELSGFDLAETAKLSEFNNTAQIVFISAITESKNKINGYELGAFSYIEKPFSPSIVKAQIYNFLKTREEQKKQKEQKDNFVATLTHDLKSPINAEISALNYLIKSPQENNDINNEMLLELLNSAKYMKHITDKILSHYKQKKGQIILKKEEISPYKLVLSCIEELKYLALEKNINIRFYNNIEKDTIFADLIEIKRVINNLISNAVEYSFKDNNIDILIKNEQNRFIFEIKDYGVGVDLKKYSKIFDEYETLSKEQKKTGFGLGLNICKNIIEAHNGEIEIFSELNKGTLIRFYLPLNC